MSSSTLDPRAKRWGLVFKYAALLGVGFLVAPIIFKAITGLIGLIAAALIMGICWMLLPAVETFGQNMRLKLLKQAAAADPIGTLQNEYHRRSQSLNERKVKIETLAAKTNGFGSKLADFKKRYPGEAQTYQDVYDKMVELLRRSRDQWKLADQQLKAFDGEIEKAKAKWEMALAAADLRQDAGKVEAEFLAKIKVECSFDTIELGMNNAFAQLDTLLMESETVEINVTGTAPQSAPTALPAPASTAIPVQALIENKAKTRA